MNLNIADKHFYETLHIKIVNVGSLKQTELPVSVFLREVLNAHAIEQLPRVRHGVNPDGCASTHVHPLFYNYAIIHHGCPILPLCSSLNVLCTISDHLVLLSED